ncbi:MAG: UbiH/UbiF/VisC/COQ6 family ubiquinone biosynthesis hydroxylase [Alphaproteobacteria bacterium]
MIQADVLIVGGGMAGQTLAAALGGAGLEVVLVDRERPAEARTLAHDGRTSAIAFGAMRALDAIGVGPRLADEAEPILEIRVSDRDSPLFLHYDHAALGNDPLGFIVENVAIRDALGEHLVGLPNVRIVAPASVAQLERGRGRATATLDDGRTVTAPLAVAADGRHSPTRRAAGINVAEWSYPQTGLVCTIAHEKPHHGVAHERFLPAGPLAVLPMRGNRSSIVWTERADLAPAMLALDDASFAREIENRFGPHLGAMTLEGARWSYPLAFTLADRYVLPRLALLGDAARAIHPIAGQGFNLGLRDAAVLAEVVVDAARLGLDPGDASVLERYERWRRFDGLALAATTDLLNRLFSTAFPPAQIVRDLGLAMVNEIPPLKRFFMRDAMGIAGDLPRLVRGERL